MTRLPFKIILLRYDLVIFSFVITEFRLKISDDIIFSTSSFLAEGFAKITWGNKIEAGCRTYLLVYILLYFYPLFLFRNKTDNISNIDP